MHNDNIVISFRPAILQDVIALNTLVNSAYRGDSSKIGWTTEADLLDGQRVDPDGWCIIANQYGAARSKRY